MKKFINTDRLLRYVVLFLSMCILLVLSISFYVFFQERYESAPEDEYERVKSYMVQCYASEGFYPPNLDYLEENYALELKKDDFIYFYDAFSSNIMPDLTVEKQFK